MSGQQADPKSDDEELRLFEEALAADAAATEKAAGSISIPTPPMRTGAQNLQSMNPNIALVLEDKIGVFMPCNVLVQETLDGKTEVSAMNPLVAMAAVENPALEEFAQEVSEALGRVIAGM